MGVYGIYFLKINLEIGLKLPGEIHPHFVDQCEEDLVCEDIKLLVLDRNLQLEHKITRTA